MTEKEILDLIDATYVRLGSRDEHKAMKDALAYLTPRVFATERTMEALRKVAQSHIERFTTFYKFADAAGNAIKQGSSNVDTLSAVVEDLALLVNSMARRIDELESSVSVSRRYS